MINQVKHFKRKVNMDKCKERQITRKKERENIRQINKILPQSRTKKLEKYEKYRKK